MTPRLLFANLGADVARCIKAREQGDDAQFKDSLARGYKTLEMLHSFGRPEAYEEGLLMLRGVVLVQTPIELKNFARHISALVAQYSPFV